MENTLITQDRLDELVRLCKLTPKGNIAEVGVYKGGSMKLLCESFPDRTILGYDTFSGLPESKWTQEEVHKPGDFSDNSIEAVSEFLKPLMNYGLLRGTFPEQTGSFHIESKFSFIHVDTDFYKSVKDCIDYFYPKLLSGGIMVFDDYEWPNCPGVKKALDESGLKYQKTNAKFQAYLIKE